MGVVGGEEACSDLQGEEPEEREVVLLEHIAYDAGDDAPADTQRRAKLL